MNELLQQITDLADQAKGLAETVRILKLADASKSSMKVSLVDANAQTLTAGDDVASGIFVRGLKSLIGDCETALTGTFGKMQAAIAAASTPATNGGSGSASGQASGGSVLPGAT
jgi:hypothetical protein